MCSKCNINTIISIFFSSVLFCFPSSQAAGYLSPHQPLAAGNTLLSDGGIFELGFFSVSRSNKTYMGIWYRNSKRSRIIWVANRDSPIYDSSASLAIAGDGNLILLNSIKTILWSSNISSSISNTNVTAKLHDTGNLILGKPSGMLWQSFDHPTDTYLSGMRVGLDLKTKKNQVLTSWRSADDPAPGNFSLGLDPSGSTQVFMWESNLLRWRSGIWNGQVFIGVETMLYAYFYDLKLSDIDEEQKMYYYTHSNSSQYWVLTPEGSFRYVMWLGEASWRIIWAGPNSACEEYNKCGNNAGCDIMKTPMCGCLNGFVPRWSIQWESGNWTGGCVRRTKLDCHEDEGEKYKDEFYLIRGVKLPDLATIVHIALDFGACQEMCVDKCSCIAFSVVRGIGCLTWGEEMKDIQIFLNGGGNDLYIRLAGSEFGHEVRRDKTKMIITLAAVFGLGSFGCIYLLWKYEKRIKEQFKRRRRSQHEENTALFGLAEIQEEGNDGKQYELRAFSFHDMVVATDNFSYENLLGEGGFGPVYKIKRTCLWSFLDKQSPALFYASQLQARILQPSLYEK